MADVTFVNPSHRSNACMNMAIAIDNRKLRKFYKKQDKTDGKEQAVRQTHDPQGIKDRLRQKLAEKRAI